MTDTTLTRWTGWVVFAGVIMLVAGFFDIIYGLIAIIGPDSAYFLAATGDLFLLDVSGWGWWHVISGVLLVLVGIFLMTGATWARVVGVILVALNALGQLALLPVQPWWSLIVLALDILVIYAIIVHGREMRVADSV
ncbi:DUF7144 family membrane protein [Microbacterium immunditiarum]|uniref:DUF7144 domain-containing protein n=1 Tax=Microbacterium immunditiarum TaxID=337480 RepID=A0A7Y9GQT7_9MICO|nr:hypothetical protein [Microbacterium immunditiarum]NYE20909.1 hypothetical protein [Microbacterium immunditiarum]